MLKTTLVPRSHRLSERVCSHTKSPRWKPNARQFAERAAASASTTPAALLHEAPARVARGVWRLAAVGAPERAVEGLLTAAAAGAAAPSCARAARARARSSFARAQGFCAGKSRCARQRARDVQTARAQAVLAPVRSQRAAMRTGLLREQRGRAALALPQLRDARGPGLRQTQPRGQ